MKTPYLVTVELEIAIFLDDEDKKTIKYDREFVQAIEDQISAGADITIQPLDRIPNGWEPESLVYNAPGDITLAQALDWEKSHPELLQKKIDKQTLPLPFPKGK